METGNVRTYSRHLTAHVRAVPGCNATPKEEKRTASQVPRTVGRTKTVPWKTMGDTSFTGRAPEVFFELLLGHGVNSITRLVINSL